MSVERIAALPMYDFPQLAPAHDALWSMLAQRLDAGGVAGVPQRLTRDLDHVQTWSHPRLLLGQACEYPLAKGLSGLVRVIATPRYSAPGCEAARYRSVIVVRTDDTAETLVDLRQRRCVVNQMDSNSGMNLLRAAVAPVAAAGRFFSAVQVSGSHLESARMIAGGAADVAALDCVSYAHVMGTDAPLGAALRVLAWTPSSPSLPLITARATDDATVRALRAALAEVGADPTLAAVRDRLLLTGFDLEPRADYSEVLRLEQAAAQLGYPLLH